MRWTVARKRALVEEARESHERRVAILAEHSISDEEFRQWELDYDISGDLRVTRIQDPRRRRYRGGQHAGT